MVLLKLLDCGNYLFELQDLFILPGLQFVDVREINVALSLPQSEVDLHDVI